MCYANSVKGCANGSVCVCVCVCVRVCMCERGWVGVGVVVRLSATKAGSRMRHKTSFRIQFNSI